MESTKGKWGVIGTLKGGVIGTLVQAKALKYMVF